jgi:ABC-type Na+ efflux pump permease subunit
MKVVLALVGLFVGAIAGGAIGVGAGLLWTTVFHTSDFEGYSGMLVFFTFMPIGIIVGAVLGAAGLVYLASREGAS